MPAGEQAGGTTWNQGSDVTTRYPELTTSTPVVIEATTLAQIVAEVQDIIKSKLRPHWDVDDDTYFSVTNIVTYAPAVKQIHLRWSAGEAYMAITGRNSVGTARPAEYGAILIDEARALLDELIASGSLAVARRSSPADGAVAFSTATLSTPVFSDGDETTIPYTPTSGTRDTDPWQ